MQRVVWERGNHPERSIPSLDGWRAVAIMLVLLVHLWNTRNFPGTDNPLLLGLLNQGELGVRVFFCLSGFLITTLLLREHEKTGSISLRAFYLRRAVRILPVYFCYLLVLFTLQCLGLYHDEASTWIGVLSFTRNVVGQGNSGTGHLWSLAVEEQFYLSWPVIFVVFGLGRRRGLALFILLMGCVTVCAVRPIECNDPSFLCKRILAGKSIIKVADALLAGCAFAYFNAPAANLLQRYARPALAISIISIVSIQTAMEVGDHSAKMRSLLLLGQSIALCSAVISSTQPTMSPAFRLLNSSPLIFIGTISYSLYIWHFLFLEKYMGPKIGDGSLKALYDYRFYVIPSAAVATVSFYCLERPLVDLRRRLTRGQNVLPPSHTYLGLPKDSPSQLGFTKQ